MVASGGNCLSRGNFHTRLDVSAARVTKYVVNRLRTAWNLKKGFSANQAARLESVSRPVTLP